MKDLEQFVLGYSAIEIIFATIGLFMGLLISVMISFILEFIGTDLINRIVPILLTLSLSYLGFQFGLKKRDEMLLFYQKIWRVRWRLMPAMLCRKLLIRVRLLMAVF